MKLHRLSVTNYRGIAHRDIEFPERGVVVVSGANEVGKTSMIEALDLLIESKDRSTRKDVKQVKPTHADVGAEVEAEISCGPYRFVYRKRFHKRTETHLTIVEPRREQLSGDEAHERVLEMLSRSMDMNLWKAQRVLQSTGAGTVDLSASDALTRALDLAAGQSVALSGTEPDLMERIDAEYALYFTATGRPTGAWAKSTARLSSAEAALSTAVSAVTEVDLQTRQHDELTRELASVIEEQAAVSRLLVPLQQAAQAISSITQQRDNAILVAEAARANLAAARAACEERDQSVAEIGARRDALGDLSGRLAAAEEEQGAAQRVVEAAAVSARQTAAALDTTRAELKTAHAVLDDALTRHEAARLSETVSRVDAAMCRLAAVRDEISENTMDTEALAAIESADRAMCLAQAALDATSARVEIRALADVRVTNDGVPVTVGAGTDWSSTATGIVEIDIPGVAFARVVPGASAAQMRDAVDNARKELSDLLVAAAVPDVDQARQRHRRGLELAAERDQLAALLDGLLGGDDAKALGEKLTRLRALALETPTSGKIVDAGEARAELARLESEVEKAQAAEVAHRQAEQVAGQLLMERSTETTALREKRAARVEELAALDGRVETARATAPDEALTARHAEAQEAAELTARRVADLAGQLAALQSDRVTAELADVGARAGALDARYRTLREQLRDISVRLEVFGRQGRQDQFDAAATEREYAAAEFARVGAKARAVDTLRSVMLRHRDGMRLRYVDPFRAELERLGRMVFGETFEVDVDGDLTIRSRTLDGRTVPYESLSGGAKEQLGIVARLAGAALVAPQDAVPVVIDDALGFTDGERLERMGAVFDAVGTQAQVIVLTCTPERYGAVTAAERISLPA